VLAILVLGWLVGLLVLYADRPWWPGRSRDVAETGSFVLWASLICAQTALWALLLAWLLPTVRRLGAEYWSENANEIVWSAAAILVIVVLVAIVPPLTRSFPNYLPNHAVKLAFLTILGGLVGLVPACGIWLVHGGLKRLGRDVDRNEDSIRTYLALEARLHRFLATLGAILGLLILTTAALRRVVVEYATKYTHETAADFPYEYVLLYGLLFSLLVAAVYLPTHLTLIRVGRSLVDSFFPGVSPTHPEWEERMAKREKLTAALQLGVGPFARLRTSAAILTPLLGSLTGLLLKGG
jgi:hypothetical protein